ncbi:TPA: hypothetical protein ACTW89_004345, partial [Raoultella ornithinolytica]
MGDGVSELTAALATIEKCREVSGCPAGVDLQGHLRQLAAENMGLKGALTGSAYINFIKANGWNASASTVNGKFVNFADPEVDFGSMVFAHAKKLVDDIKTPATSDYLAGIKADGVEEFLKGSQLPYQIATVLADYDNADDETLHHVIWSGQPPEPDGDVWHLEYVSRGNAIVREVLKQLREG